MSNIEFATLGPSDYDRAKKILDAARHPGFVGRELFFRCSTTGSVTVATLDGTDVGVMMIAKHKVQALSVIVKAQGHGVGAALVGHLKPRWVNAIGERVPWFEKRGYRCVGAPKVGQNGKHSTQLLELVDEAAASASTSSGGSVDAGASQSDSGPQDDSAAELSLYTMIDPHLALTTAEEGELDMLDALLHDARAAQQFKSVLEIMASAKKIAARARREGRVR